MINGKKVETINNAVQADCNVEEQYQLAKLLAANCGYQLVEEDDERSLEIKELIKILKTNGRTDRHIILFIEGLKALLK